MDGGAGGVRREKTVSITTERFDGASGYKTFVLLSLGIFFGCD